MSDPRQAAREERLRDALAEVIREASRPPAWDERGRMKLAMRLANIADAALADIRRVGTGHCDNPNCPGAECSDARRRRQIDPMS